MRAQSALLLMIGRRVQEEPNLERAAADILDGSLRGAASGSDTGDRRPERSRTVGELRSVREAAK